MALHAPTPTRAVSSSYSLNAPASPRLGAIKIERPSSRSERLLRDTLRRADQVDRHSRPDDLDRHSRPTRGPSGHYESDEEDEDESWLQRVRSRAGSMDRGHQRESFVPSTPRRISLQRSPATSPAVPTSPPRSPLLRAISTPSRSPNETVLRSRLENTLKREHRKHERRASQTNSVGTSSEPWSSSQPSPMLTPPPTPPHTMTGLPRTLTSSSSSSAEKQFNARKASDMCRQRDGYISFGDVEGLGSPPEDGDDDDEHKRKWKVFLGWFGLRASNIERSETY